MPRANAAKIWIEYDPTTGGTNIPMIVRAFLAVTPALWSAVEHGNKVVGALPGETLAEAIARDTAEKRPASTPVVAKPVRTDPALAS